MAARDRRAQWHTSSQAAILDVGLTVAVLLGRSSVATSRAVRYRSTGGSVSQRKPFGASAHMSSGAKATLLPLLRKKTQKKINKISLWPVVSVWHIFLIQHFVIGRHKCCDRHESADICVIAARICGGICSATIKCAAAICTLINQRAEKNAARRKMSVLNVWSNAPSHSFLGFAAEGLCPLWRTLIFNVRDGVSSPHRCVSWCRT